MKMEAETGVMQPQAKKYQGFPTTTRRGSNERTLPGSVQRNHDPDDTLISDL